MMTSSKVSKKKVFVISWALNTTSFGVDFDSSLVIVFVVDTSSAVLGGKTAGIVKEEDASILLIVYSILLVHKYLARMMCQYEYH